MTERDAHFKSARASMEKLAGLDAQAAVQSSETRMDGLRIVTRVFSGVAPEYVQAFAREVAEWTKPSRWWRVASADTYFSRSIRRQERK